MQTATLADAPIRLGRRRTDPIIRPGDVMSDNEMTEYLRSVEGRLSRVEESVGQYKVERAEIRKDLAELKESIAKQSEALIQWQRTVDVTLAGRSVLERLGWLVIGSIVTGAVTLWWNLWR